MSSSAINDEITRIINNNIKPNENDNSKLQNTGIIDTNVLNTINNAKNTDYYLKIYSKEDPRRQINNEDIFYYLNVVNVLLVIILLIFTIYLVSTKQIQMFDIVEILLENIITFLLLGMIEIAFFLNVALKFIPTKPSLIYESFITALKTQMNN